MRWSAEEGGTSSEEAAAARGWFHGADECAETLAHLRACVDVAWRLGRAGFPDQVIEFAECRHEHMTRLAVHARKRRG